MPVTFHPIWEFSGNTGYNIISKISNFGNLILQNEAYWLGDGIEGDTTNDYAVAECDLYNTNYYDNCTWIFRYTCKSISGATKGIAQIAKNLSDGIPFILIQNNNGDLKFYVAHGYHLTLSSFLVVGTTYNIAVVRTGLNWYFYVDGVQRGNQSGENSTENQHALRIYLNNGYDGYAGGNYKCNIVFNQALNSSQVATLSADLYGLVRQPSMEELWAHVVAVGGVAPTGVFYGPLYGPLGGPI